MIKKFCFFLITLMLMQFNIVQAEEDIYLKELGVTISFPEGYQIVPSFIWKQAVREGQQFTLKNTYDFDYLIQKIDSENFELFESSSFFIKTKRAREITNEEFEYYVKKFFIDYEKLFKERQSEGLISNMVNVKVVHGPIIDYNQKHVWLKSDIEFGGMKETNIIYSKFFPSGNLLLTGDFDEIDLQFIYKNFNF
jgi:hypothetical protein